MTDTLGLGGVGDRIDDRGYSRDDRSGDGVHPPLHQPHSLFKVVGPAVVLSVKLVKFAFDGI